MSEIIELTKNSIGNFKFMHHAICFAKIFVSTIMNDLGLLDTSYQQLCQIVIIAMNNNFKHCHVYTTRFSQ